MGVIEMRPEIQTETQRVYIFIVCYAFEKTDWRSNGNSLTIYSLHAATIHLRIKCVFVLYIYFSFFYGNSSRQLLPVLLYASKIKQRMKISTKPIRWLQPYCSWPYSWAEWNAIKLVNYCANELRWWLNEIALA